MSELSRVTVTTNGSVMNSGTSDQAIEAAPYLVRTFDGGGGMLKHMHCACTCMWGYLCALFCMHN